MLYDNLFLVQLLHCIQVYTYELPGDYVNVDLVDKMLRIFVSHLRV